MALIKRLITALLLVVISGSPAARAAGPKQEDADSRQDYVSARQDILQFEGIINDVINSSFSTSPFAVVQKAKGAYLQGYGLSFAFLVNIHRAVKRTPFGTIGPKNTMTLELKKQRIEELKEKLIRALQDNGENFRILRKEDYVTIIAYVEDRNLPDEPNSNKTIVLSALKKDLDEYGKRSDRLREFKQRMKIVEY
jgi:hypothetical protein